MIRLTRLNGEEFYLNSDLIETVEATPDSVISLTTRRKIVVRESVAEIVDRVKAYRRDIGGPIREPEVASDE
jgi:flagellar protein FlbD